MKDEIVKSSYQEFQKRNVKTPRLFPPPPIFQNKYIRLKDESTPKRHPKKRRSLTSVVLNLALERSYMHLLFPQISHTE